MNMTKGVPTNPGGYLVRYFEKGQSESSYKIIIVMPELTLYENVLKTTTHHVKLEDIEASL